MKVHGLNFLRHKLILFQTLAAFYSTVHKHIIANTVLYCNNAQVLWCTAVGDCDVWWGTTDGTVS